MNDQERVTSEERALEITKATPQLSRLLIQLVAEERFILVIGAGCSIPCGLPDFTTLKRKLTVILSGAITNVHPAEKALAEADIEQFDLLWQHAGPKFRRTAITNIIPPRPSHLRGYYPLAELIRNKVFSMVLNYNFDVCLETALHSIGFDQFLVLVNGCHTMEYIRQTIEDPRLPLIIKTHGDYNHGVYALSRREIIEFSEAIGDIVTHLTSNKLLIVGYSGSDYPFMRHVDLNRCSEELWFANPDPPPTYLADVMRERRSSDNWVPIGFNDLFTTILYAMRRHKSPEEFVPRSREHSGGSITVKLRVLNRLGIHTAAAAKIIKLTNKFHCEMFLRYDGFEINVKSLIGIMTLGVTYGKEVELYIEGDDCEQAAKEMKALFDNKFYEED